MRGIMQRTPSRCQTAPLWHCSCDMLASLADKGGNAMALPLAGIRVLDIASMLAGPYGATMLGDMGADVIKIEPPYGDESRTIGPKVDNDSGYFVGINRNKRGIVLDLTKPEGRDLYFRLVRTADIIIDNLRPQAK